MKYLIPVVLAILLSSPLNAQSVYGIPLDTIEQMVTKTEGLYDFVAARFMNADTTMELMDYLLLYYGSAYREGYSPYGERTLRMAIRELMEQEKYDDAIVMGEGLIRDNPACAGVFYDLGLAAHLKGDTIAAMRYFDRYGALIAIPYYSGNGFTSDSAMVVRSIDDEYLIMNELEFKKEKQSLLTIDGLPYDLLEGRIEDESGTLIEDKIYFNIYQPYILGLAKVLQDTAPAKGNNKKSKKEKKREKKKNRK